MSSVSGVNPFTNPTNSSFGLFFVKKLITIVKMKQISHAHQALQKFAAISVLTLEKVNKLRLTQLNLTAKNKVNDEPIPATSPQKAPFGVIHQINIPRSIVANRGAFT